MRTIIGGPIRNTPPERPLNSSCFHEETIIKTSNGAKMIKDIDLAADTIWNPVCKKWMGLSRRTVTLWQGDLCKIKTAENELITTDNHPFMLTNGLVLKAKNLEVGDVLDNGNEGVVITAMETYTTQEYLIVHNLVFKKAGIENIAHFVEANGIPSGTLHLQDKIANTSFTKALELSK